MTEPQRVRAGDSADLVQALASGADRIGDLEIRRFLPVPHGPLDERPITVDQTNQSVVVGERAVVKWMRKPEDRAPMLLAHLAEVGFDRTPTPYAALYRGSELIALVTAFLPEALDGWDWCVDALIGACEGGPPAGFAAAIGALAGELHAALATPSSTFAEPVAGAANPGWSRAGLSVLDEARSVLATDGSDDARWFESIHRQLGEEIDRAGAVVRTPLIHPHGDLHVGQVLKWRRGLAVTDFDGNPTVDAPTMEPAARDVAQLRTSLLHVGEIANRRTEGRFRAEIHAWGRDSADQLLDAYQQVLAARGLDAIFDPALLRPFEVEQECRELLYAARFLPRWRYAPMGVLRNWYGGLA